MATILTFKKRPAARPPTKRGDRVAQVVIFPGVRHERLGKTAVCYAKLPSNQ